jgi:acyl carrier protein
MSARDIRKEVIAALMSIAPELEEAELRPDRPLRDQIDLDSMDWLNVIVALHERLKVEIPESDYAKLTTRDAVVAYICAKRSGEPAPRTLRGLSRSASSSGPRARASLRSRGHARSAACPGWC